MIRTRCTLQISDRLNFFSICTLPFVCGLEMGRFGLKADFMFLLNLSDRTNQRDKIRVYGLCYGAMFAAPHNFV